MLYGGPVIEKVLHNNVGSHIIGVSLSEPHINGTAIAEL